MSRGVRALCAGVLVTATAALLPVVTSSSAVPTSPVAWTQADATPSGCVDNCSAGPATEYSDQSLAYDAATHQMILFAGGGNSTWSWSGTAWTQVDDTGDPGCVGSCTDSPTNRDPFNMAYDPASKTIVLFGGEDYNDTWAWDGTTWTQVDDAGDAGCTTECTNSPPPNIGGSMAYDPATNQMVLFGGGDADYDYDFDATWVLTYHDATYTWTQADDSTDPGCLTACVNSPPVANLAAMAYDPVTKQLIEFGGEHTAGDADGQNSTWAWNGKIWTDVGDRNGADAGCGVSEPTTISCPNSPPARIAAGLTFDPALGQLVLFGGMNHFGEPEYNDTWLWNGAGWKEVDDTTDLGCTSSCVGSPQGRDTFGMAVDGATNQLVIYGGYNLDNTWVAPAKPAPPSAPNALKTTAKGFAIVASWGGPTYAGATAVTKYQVRALPGGTSCVTTTRSCALNGLSATAHYNIEVRAFNSIGAGPWAVLNHVKG